MALNMIKGVVFDLDGTLIHSSIDFPKMKRHMIDIFEANGVPQGLLTTKDMNVEIFEKAERAWDERGKPESERVGVRAQLEEAMNQGELEAIATVEQVEEATETVRTLKERGYKLAILTRSHHTYAVEALKKIGAYEYFDLIIGRNEAPKPKPYAEAMEHTAELMGMRLDEVVLVGDHRLDMMSAASAGCLFIGVRTGRRGDESWGDQKPEALFDSISDIPAYLEDL
jgi:HAD superfamily hydrolase (TIGR01549 family)